jgi:lysozyme family protein
MDVTATKFSRSLHTVLNYEGGYVNNPKDPGGATNKGITQRVYDAYRHWMKRPIQTVQKITDPEVEDVYCNSYWKPMKCEAFKLPVALCMFDSAVQWGVHGALVLMGEALGLPMVSDSLTILKSLGLHTDQRDLVLRIYKARAARRLKRVLQAPSQIVFLKGWQQRDTALRDLALKYVVEDVVARTGPPGTV